MLEAFVAVLGEDDLEIDVVSSAPRSVLPANFDDFLYASVGESSNGALLTVLSVIARQNVDPWETAADLSRLPPEAAARQLTSMIRASPHGPSAIDQAATADRLIALLRSPTARENTEGSRNALRSDAPVQRPPPGVTLMVIAIYLWVMFLGQWMLASRFKEAPAEIPASAKTASALGETLPSKPDPGQAPNSPRP